MGSEVRPRGPLASKGNPHASLHGCPPPRRPREHRRRGSRTRRRPRRSRTTTACTTCATGSTSRAGRSSASSTLPTPRPPTPCTARPTAWSQTRSILVVERAFDAIEWAHARRARRGARPRWSRALDGALAGRGGLSSSAARRASASPPWSARSRRGLRAGDRPVGGATTSRPRTRWRHSRTPSPRSRPRLAAGGDRIRLFRALRDALAGSPGLLILEDLHWADEATMDALRFLARRLDGVPVLIIATYRDDEVSPRHPLSLLMGDLTERPRCAAHGRASPDRLPGSHCSPSRPGRWSTPRHCTRAQRATRSS